MSSTTTATHTPWELGVAYILHCWPALTLAVTSHWGGPNSSEKRDWLCGAIADMFPSLDQTLTSSANPTGEDNGEPDEFDVEETLAQVMQDEFEVSVEDDSIIPVAKQIIQLRSALLQGNFGLVDKLREKFEQNKNKPIPAAPPEGANKDQNDDENSEEDSDEEMGDADDAVDNTDSATLQRTGPVVDDEGFELVQNRRRR